MFHNVTLVDLEELKEKNNSFVSAKNELLWSTQLKENSKSLQKYPAFGDFCIAKVGVNIHIRNNTEATRQKKKS